jgi:hypothetical protein
MQLILNGDSHPLPFFLAASSDHLTGLAAAAPTVTISKNGAAFAAPAGAVAEIGNGWYKLTPSGADTTTNGMLLLHATAASADPADVKSQVVAFSPYDANALGLVRLDAAVSTRQASGNVTIAGYAAGEDPATLVWNALLASFNTANSFGAFVQSITSGGSGGVTMDSSYSSHTTAGTMGALFNHLAPISIDGSGNVALSAATENAIADAHLDRVNGIEAGLTPRQAQRLQTAFAAGVVAGAPNGPITIAAAGNPGTMRISATVTIDGNRTAVTLTP